MMSESSPAAKGLNVQGSLKRPTIGFLTANIHIGAARSVWPGVLDAAQERNANLICYPGGRLHAPDDYESERNILYHLVDKERLDGLVSWASALAGTVTSKEVADFHQRYVPCPLISLAFSIGDSPLVSINGYEGMRAIVFHLIDVHHYRSVAFIRGPEGHPYAMERYQAYLDALNERGLSPDPSHITPTMEWEKGAEAMAVLLDERNLKPGIDFQAVVAVSDLLAIGALNMMTDRGIRVPTDVAVVGFNDIEEGRLVRPSLTSVSLPFYDQGRRSVEVLLDLLAGSAVPDHTKLDSHLLVRQSCGCSSQSVDLASAQITASESQDLRGALKSAQENLVDQIAQVIGIRGVAATWAKQLTDALYREVSSGRYGQFRSTLDGMLQQGALDGDETAAWQSAISVLRRSLLPVLDGEPRLQMENLFGQARVVIGEAIQRAQIARQLHAEHQSQVLREIGQELITTFEVNRLADVLADRMPELGIESCYLALYENPDDSIDWSRMVLAYTDGERANLGSVGRRFRSCQLVPPDLLPARRYSLLVEPLYFQTHPLGFAIFEVGPRDGAVYEVLRGHISSALKGALLFREAHEARLAAERADQIKTRLLANVSHELRTPLNIIIGHAQRIQNVLASSVAEDLKHIERSAEHQLRIINDLLDLSRAEINALDLFPELLDPGLLIKDAFLSLSENAAAPGNVKWRLEVPDSLPLIKADPVRLRQILLNLLSNSAKFTEHGQITLGAELAPPHLHIWVADTGSGIPPDISERIYDPFFTHERSDRQPTGIGLGLSITRHLVEIHNGFIALDSEPDRGSTFHIYLPLPEPVDQPSLTAQPGATALWFVSDAESIPIQITRFSHNQHLAIHRVGIDSDLVETLAGGMPAVVIWDMTSAAPNSWQQIRRLHNHPHLSQTPFILYQQEADGEMSAGLTSLIVKPASGQALWEAIRHNTPQESNGSILIIDDDERARKLAFETVSKGLPGYTIRIADGGKAGLAAALADPPSMVILDLMMPDMDGFEVLDRIRMDERTRQIPVMILSARRLSSSDVQRLEQHAAVRLQSKGVLSDDEVIAALHQTLVGTQTLPPQTSALAKRAVAFIHQNFAHPFARREIAEAIGVHEDYLSRVFNQELGISPWDYLNRYRIYQAKKLLHSTDDSISGIARRVGLPDSAYFSRVFHRVTGMSPREYRDHQDDQAQ